MDTNGLVGWWIHGLRGIVQGLTDVTDHGHSCSEGNQQVLDDYIKKLTALSEKLRENREGK